VTGTITTANVIAGATATQQLVAGDLAAVIAAIRSGAAYANVHTTPSPGGEIRGQIKHDRQIRVQTGCALSSRSLTSSKWRLQSLSGAQATADPGQPGG
jgi:CHRD domain